MKEYGQDETENFLTAIDINEETKEMLNATIELHPSTPYPTPLHPTPPNSTLEEDSRGLKIKSMLSQGRPEKAQLKCGLHNNTFYYGTIIYDDERKPKTAVVTNKREIFVDWGNHKNEIKNELELDYRYDFEWEVLDAHWSTNSILDFLSNDRSAEPLKNLFLEIKGNNKEYMWYPDEITHEVVALEILSTYFLPVFTAKGRNFLEAEQGSGKTRQCSLFKLQAFNSVMSADISKSAFYRLMESTCGTLIIDDFDSINEEQKNDVLQHYKTGYKNNSKTVRTGEGRSRKSDAFRNYGHVVMNNTTGLDDISAERTIYIPLLKTDKEVTKNNINENDKKWERLRDELFLAGLTYWKNVQEAYNKLDSELSGRKFEISRPILAIASIIDSELKERIEEWLKDRFKDTNSIDPESDWKYLALQEFKEVKEGQNVRMKDVAEIIANKTLNEERKDFSSKVHGISIFLGKMFRNLAGIFKVVIINGSNHVKLISRDRLEDYMKTKGWSWVECSGVGSGNKISRIRKIFMRNRPNNLNENELVSIDEFFKKNFEGICSEEEFNVVYERLKKEGEIHEPKPGKFQWI